MFAKRFLQIVVVLIIVAACLAIPRGASAQGPCGPTYVVQPGDWLSKIAIRCQVSLSDLEDANPGVEWQRYIYPGEVLNIPGEQVPNPVLPPQYPPAQASGCPTPWCQPFLPAASPYQAPYYWWPSMTVAPYVGSSFSWMTVPVNKSLTFYARLRNNGDLPLQVSASMTPPSGFDLGASSNDCPASLPVAGTCTYTWVLTPHQTGDFYVRVYGKGYYVLSGMTERVTNSSAFFFIVQ